MQIDTIVLLVGIAVFGMVQMTNLCYSMKCFNKLFGLMERTTDTMMKIYEKIAQD